MLEAYKHAYNSFVTLTYSDGKPDRKTGKIITRRDGSPALPPGGNLEPKDLQDFLKRLRKRFGSLTLRYYACGEYGEKDQRPHYHLALFGAGIEDTEAINSAWGLGFVYVGDLTHDSAQYIAGYVTKKMTSWDDPRLDGRHPEFARMSLRPGIGATAVKDIADVLTTGPGCDALARVGDVPHALMLEKKSIPLGKYIRGKLRQKMGFPDAKAPKETIDQWKAEVRELYKDAKSTSADSALSRYIDKTEHFKKYLIDKNAQKVLQLESRNKIFSAKKDKL